MDKNLVSLSELQSDIKSMKYLSIFLNREQRGQLKNLEKQVDNMALQIASFNERFSPHGWCAYDSMNSSLIKNANAVFEQGGLAEAEQVLIHYYKSDVREVTHWIKNSSEAFAVRYDLLKKFFEDHFVERYHASIPLGLIIIDGAVNDFTKRQGFFAEGTTVDAWDCLVGCSDGLTKLKSIFTKNRTKTNTEAITLPYRNGILHGRDLNYANEYVACKCVALMFAVADWMKMKSSESDRKAKYEKSITHVPIKEILAKSEENKQIQKEIASWEKKVVTVGKDIPANGTQENYEEYPYVVAVIEMLSAWKNKNYGKLSSYLQKMFPGDISDGKRAGECRKFFENKILKTFELVEIEERACALSKVSVKVSWIDNGKEKEAVLIFGCVYKGIDGRVGLPWRNDGKWILNPWDIRGLYL
nr:hypothetical protein [uncultured Oscillibacter sp.]